MSTYQPLALAIFLLAASGCGGSSSGGPSGPTGPSTETPVTPTAPSARRHSAMVYDQARQRVLLFGGVSEGTNLELDDLWSWDGTAWTRLSASTGGRTTGTQMYASPTDVFS